MTETRISTDGSDLTAADKNKAVCRRFIQEVFNEGRLDALEEVLSPSYVYRDAPPGTPSGSDGIKQIVSMFRAAFPDMEITIVEHAGRRSAAQTSSPALGSSTANAPQQAMFVMSAALRV